MAKNISLITSIDISSNIQDVFYHISHQDRPEFISYLDSSLQSTKYGRFSYLAWEPDFVVRGNGHTNEFRELPQGKKKVNHTHPLTFLREVFNAHVPRATEKIMLENDDFIKISAADYQKAGVPDFTGGFIGYFSYELKNYIEKLPQSAKNDLGIPIFCLVFYSTILSFDHHLSRWYLIKNYNVGEFKPGMGSLPELGNDLVKHKKRITGHLNVLSGSYHNTVNFLITHKYLPSKLKKTKLNSNFSRENYLKAVIKAKKHIHRGDIYQANLTQRFSCNLKVDPVDLYYILRQKNPAPFSAFLGLGKIKVGSSSPERFLFLKGRVIETRPIKGTMPRGKDEKEDLKNTMELQNSLKDRAELNMIVDLERNDLGRFCEYGSVKVREHAIVEKYARVLHLVSTVRGIVRRGYDLVDILKATFPGGSITGAPKIRAMEIIDDLEPNARSVYTGSLGYIGVGGYMDLNIVIRTFIIKGNKFYFNVGGGIVEDSRPESEYLETLDKASALKETLGFFRNFH